MDDATLANLLDVHCDSNNRVRAVYAHLLKMDLTLAQQQEIIVYIQTAFWAGAEAAVGDEDFINAIMEICNEREKEAKENK